MKTKIAKTAKFNFTKLIITSKLSLLILIGLSFNLGGQTKDVPLNIISNTPKHITSLMFGYKYGASSSNPLLFTNAIDVCFNATRFNLAVGYEWLLPMIYDPLEMDLEHLENKFQKIEIAASFGLWTKVKDEDIEVTWSGGYNQQWAVDVPVKALKVKGLHLGITQMQSFIEINKLYYDYRNMAGFFGYFWSKYSNYKFSVDGRYKSGYRFHTSYLDIFYSPKTTDSFLAQNTDYLPYGARLGSHVYSLRNIGFSYKMEFGVLPKNFVSNSGGKGLGYYYFKFGIGINGCLRHSGKEFEI